MTASEARTWQLPAMDASNADFLKAANEERLISRRCNSCGEWHWYPRPVCPYCQGEASWQGLSGKGEIYSVTVTRRGGPAPYALAYVRLDEGITLLTQIVECEWDALQIGQRVEVCFQAADDGQKWPLFRPA